MIDFSRRRVLAGTAAGLIARPAFGQSAANEMNERLSRALQDGKVIGMHALLVAPGSNLLLEQYRRGYDEAWDRPLGVINFAPDVLHDVRSVSKSVVGLLYGMRLQRARCHRLKRSSMISSRNIKTWAGSQAGIGSPCVTHLA